MFDNEDGARSEDPIETVKTGIREHIKRKGTYPEYITMLSEANGSSYALTIMDSRHELGKPYASDALIHSREFRDYEDLTKDTYLTGKFVNELGYQVADTVNAFGEVPNVETNEIIFKRATDCQEELFGNYSMQDNGKNDELLGNLFGRPAHEVMLARTGYFTQGFPQVVTIFTQHNLSQNIYLKSVFNGPVEPDFANLRPESFLHHETGKSSDEIRNWYDLHVEALAGLGYKLTGFKSHPTDSPSLQLFEERLERV